MPFPQNAEGGNPLCNETKNMVETYQPESLQGLIKMYLKLPSYANAVPLSNHFLLMSRIDKSWTHDSTNQRFYEKNIISGWLTLSTTL